MWSVEAGGEVGQGGQYRACPGNITAPSPASSVEQLVYSGQSCGAAAYQQVSRSTECH